MHEQRPSRETLLIIIAVLLALILLVGTGFGFYYLGLKKGGTTGKSTPISGETADQNGISGEGSATADANKVRQVLEGLKGGSGTYDPNTVESQLSELLSKEGGQYSTTISLVSESEVKTSSASGKDAINTYLNAVEKIIAGSQTTTISESALTGLFSGDTSALDAEITKNQKIYTDLKNVATPQETVTLQRKYLTLFKTSVEVMQAEKAMITGANMDYNSIAKAQGLISLSKEIDNEVKNLKSKYGI